jgi:hypothetical protein
MRNEAIAMKHSSFTSELQVTDSAMSVMLSFTFYLLRVYSRELLGYNL